MADLITPSTIAKRALATLYNSTVLAGLVYRDYDPSFAARQGDTITVRTPWVAEANEFDRGTGIVLQNVEEGSTTVQLDTRADVSVVVTSEELTLEIEDFGARILDPAMEAIVQKVDNDLALALRAAATAGGTDTHSVTVEADNDTVTATAHGYRSGTRVWFTALTGGTGLTTLTPYYVINAAANTFKVSLTDGGAAVNVTADATAGTVTEAGGGTSELASGDEASKSLLSARTTLSTNKVPQPGRAAVLSPLATESALSDPLFQQADKSGSTTALREASLGRVFGMETYETQVFDGYEGVAFQQQAIALASRTLALPMGVGEGQAAVANFNGLGLRVVRDYDIDKKQDVVSIDFLYGIKTLRPGAAVALDLEPVA